MAQNSTSTRKQVTELTKASHGGWVMATWEYYNGWNLVGIRTATPEEIEAGSK